MAETQVAEFSATLYFSFLTDKRYQKYNENSERENINIGITEIDVGPR